MSQAIRMSQFVTTYGAGAIIESPDGPRVIPRADLGLFVSGQQLDPRDFEISDQRMSIGLLHGSRIYRLPSNAELRIPESHAIYRTKAFPLWSLCVGRHDGGGSVLHRASNCPRCGAAGARYREAIRFILACPNGHMDDVNWPNVVHRAGSSCGHESWFQWAGGGGALSRVVIECPECHSKANLGQAYAASWRCSGRYPEREATDSAPSRPSCTVNARMIQRQASNLRIPEVSTLFTIPPRATPLHNVLQTHEVRAAFAAAGVPSSLSELQALLERLLANVLISRSAVEEILRHGWDEINGAIGDVQSPVPNDYGDLVREELAALLEASAAGYPPSGAEPYAFEVNPRLISIVETRCGRLLKVVPVTRLRTVTVQTGYRREVDSGQPSQVVSTGFTDPTNSANFWFPGVEFLGEGVFVTLEANPFGRTLLSGTAAEAWARLPPDGYPAQLFRSSRRDELDPAFVWWHTLSHLLIRAISVNAGYSPASIRERVYIGGEAGQRTGGVLLYATQSGSEGTLGGLTAITADFADIVGSASAAAESCSSDPLCGDSVIETSRTSGAACYACSLLSETSCEHRNMWLDRSIVRENLP